MNRSFVIGVLGGRLGNQFYQISTAYAYAKKHDLEFFVTSNAPNCDNNAYYFKQFPQRDIGSKQFFEPSDAEGYATFCEIPKIENVMLYGYWQCFDYFNDYREELLQAFNLPYNKKEGYVSLHVRRGDYLELSEKLKLTSLDYYKKAMDLFPNYKFLVFSDDIEWCKTMFTSETFESETFEFSEGKSEIEDLIEMANCEHNIVCNSTFSYAASWFNRNPDKKVVTPDENNMFKGMNRSMIPETYIKL
jgi:hypothetical protein